MSLNQSTEELDAPTPSPALQPSSGHAYHTHLGGARQYFQWSQRVLMSRDPEGSGSPIGACRSVAKRASRGCLILYLKLLGKSVHPFVRAAF